MNLLTVATLISKYYLSRLETTPGNIANDTESDYVIASVSNTRNSLPKEWLENIGDQLFNKLWETLNERLRCKKSIFIRPNSDLMQEIIDSLEIEKFPNQLFFLDTTTFFKIWGDSDNFQFIKFFEHINYD